MMTDTLPGFTFDRRTGELSRGGRIVTLNTERAELFNVIAFAMAPLARSSRDSIAPSDGVTLPTRSRRSMSSSPSSG